MTKRGGRTDIIVAVDIGSTVVKIARVSTEGELLHQEFHPRDFDAGIAAQVESLLDTPEVKPDDANVLVCSSANGGLRVGIVCLSKLFSGAVLRNQVLLAGANPIFVYDFDDVDGDTRRVDILLVGGGVDCDEAEPLARRLAAFRPEVFNFESVLWAGNRSLTQAFRDRCPDARPISNPLATDLIGRETGVTSVLRRAYLDNIIHKEGISGLRPTVSGKIVPTPEAVNRGFYRAVSNQSSFHTAAPCLLMDIGGATTDIHYTVDVVLDSSESRPQAGVSVARYVFTDLGISASKDSTVLAMRRHPRIYEFLSIVLEHEVESVYRLLREGEYEPSPQLLSYGCLFVALERFSSGGDDGLPAGDLRKLAQLVLTGGAAQMLDPKVVAGVFGLFLSDYSQNAAVSIDARYRFWVDGMVAEAARQSETGADQETRESRAMASAILAER